MDESQQVIGVAHDTFKAPVSTLLESLEEDNEITPHDLTEAYSLIYSRIKSLAPSLSDAAPTTRLPDPFQFLRQHTQEVALCVKRDIERVLEDCITDEEEFNRDAGGIIWYPSIVTDDKFRYLKESVDVSHSALQVVSSFFAFYSLSSLFSEAHIEMMLDAVLAVMLTPAMPTPGESRTRSLSIYALAALHMPAVLAQNRKIKLIGVIQSAVVGDAVVAQNEDNIADALKMLHTLLLMHPLIFLEAAMDLYPRILTLSTSPYLSVRFRAASAIASFANAIVQSYKVEDSGSTFSTKYVKIRSTIRRATLRFVHAQEAQRRQEAGHKGGAWQNNIPCLRALLHAEIPLDADTKPGPHVGWAFSLLGSLTILAGPAALSDPDHLRLIVRSVPYSVASHPWLPLRSLHGFLWRCVIWAFTLTPYMSHPKEMKNIDNWRSALRQRSADYIRPVQVLEVGPCLVYALLGKDEKPFSSTLAESLPRSDDVVRTIDVLRGLVEHPSNSFFSQGVEVFLRLTSEVGSDTSRRDHPPWDPTAPLPMKLLDGSLVDTELKHMKEALQSSTPFDINSVRPLCSTEIEEHWEQLLEVWVPAARRVFKADNSNVSHHKNNILHIWQALLLTQVRLTPSYEHLTSSSDCSARILGTITNFLSWDVAHGVQLDSVKKLWAVVKRVFSQPWIRDAAETLLRGVLRNGAIYEKESAEDYHELCTDLIFSGRPSVLGTIISGGGEDLKETTRKLWYFIAPSWSSRMPIPTWQSTAAFLSVPWRLVTPIGPERNIWSAVFDFAVSRAGNAGQPVNAVLEELSGQLSEATADLLLCLLSYVRFDDEETIPFILLGLINDYLRRYPTQSQDIYPAINIIDALSQSISTCSAHSIIPTLMALQGGMCIWIAATPELVSDDEYNQHIMGFYHNSLDSLYRATDSVQVLRDLEEYLCSPFSNIRKDAVGPLAFRSYWDKISSRIDFHGQELPDKLKNNICALYEVYGGERPSYLPTDTQSQQSVIPDSQSATGEEGLQIWYRRATSAENILPLAAGYSHEMGNRSSKAATRSNDVPEPPRHVIFPEGPASHKRTKNLYAALMSQGSEMPPVLGKREVAADIDDPNTTVRHTRTMKRSKLAHDDGSGISERGGISQFAPPLASRPCTQRVPSGGNEPGSQMQDSLPSPPLSVEVPFVGAVSPISKGKDVEDKDGLEWVGTSGVEERDVASDLVRPTAPQLQVPSTHEGAQVTASSHADQQLHVLDPRGRRGHESAYMQMLRAAHEAMNHQLADPDIAVDEVLAAQDLLNAMGGMLTDKLRSRLEARSRRSG
ncbi:hypothetical protein BDY19DRAFT_957657 [Irpex rosettiformis]|uniref:Uncharacterized protein n=1 Tax=Irpex rosettiformis TaxID=378272 RepID=A0ACB8TYA6_9APHY|nr:hypothetical protein BDY19DRAFT_957657 [Irpex rosettiformis]